jgi:hypothetical protein
MRLCRTVFIFRLKSLNIGFHEEIPIMLNIMIYSFFNAFEQEKR